MNGKPLTWEESVRWLRENSDDQVLVKHCYYDDPLELAAERFRLSEEWQALKILLKPYLPGCVLDLGAGRGISSYAFAKAGCKVTALEPDPSMLVGAGAIQSLFDATNLSLRIVEEYGESLPFKDNSFDVVYGRAVLHHARDLPKLCREAQRVLKPGGVFIATREHVISRKEDLQEFLDNHALHRLYGGENAYLLKEYIYAIKDSGMQLLKAIGPMENAINYAPLTYSGFTNMVEHTLSRFLPTSIARAGAQNKSFQRLYGRYVSQRSEEPGRHYSFLSVK